MPAMSSTIRYGMLLQTKKNKKNQDTTIMKAKYALIALLAITFWGCDDNTAGLGLGMFPGSDQNINGKLSTFDVTTESVHAGKIYAMTNVGYVGKFTDETFGTYQAGFLAQLNCPEGMTFPEAFSGTTESGTGKMMTDFKNLAEGVSGNYTIIEDEKGNPIGNCQINIYLWYDSYFGDSLTACRLSMYVLDKKKGDKYWNEDPDASDSDYKWTDVLMNRVGHRMDGLSLHYYTVTGWSGSKGSATQFNKDDYYWTMGKCLEVEDVLKKHCAIMDKYDKDKKIALLLDEWGTWWDEEPGTIKGHLYQQNTLRDAFVASLSLDVFHKYTDRLKMANIAQIVNVLQSMILTKDKEMVLTPTYYVFKMYKVHQNATYLPIDLTCEKINVRDNRTVPMVSATASKNKDGVIHISLSNVDADEAQEITINLGDTKAKKAIGEILTASKLTDYNSFEKPNIVKPAPFKEVKINKGTMKVKLPAKSIVTLELQ